LVIAEHLSNELGFAIEPTPEDGIVRNDAIDSNLEGRFEIAVQLLKLDTKMDAIRAAVAEAAERISSGGT
jgi:hypothetical protein